LLDSLLQEIDLTKMTKDRSCMTCNNVGLRNGSGPMRTPFMIGVAGGTASGKSTVCSTLVDMLGQSEVNAEEKQVVILSQDSFYRELTPVEAAKAMKGTFNFDHPDAFDNQLMESVLTDVINGRQTKVPVYDFKTNSRAPGEFTTIYPSDVVLVEGILVFYFPRMRDLFHLKLFVDTDADTRLARRVMRDIRDRGRDLENVLNQYSSLVKPAFEEFCLPTKKYADVIVPRGAENTVAIDLISQHMQDIIWRSSGSREVSPSESSNGRCKSKSKSGSDSSINSSASSGRASSSPDSRISR